MSPMPPFPFDAVMRMSAGLALVLLLGGATPIAVPAQPHRSALSSPSQTKPSQTKPSQTAIVIHGGAGGMTPSTLTAAQQDAYRASLRDALAAGQAVLQEGDSALNAVEAAIVTMEADPLFNAGRGAVRTTQHTIELDAALMNGDMRTAGAVTGVSSVKHPIRLARVVLAESEHVMLAGEGADAFAAERGVEQVEQGYFRLEHSGSSGGDAARRTTTGTVGAVALDTSGTLAAGTSTGGLSGKRVGRVGDSPIVGAGTYAHNASVAVSATGQGEYFMRGVTAHSVAARVRFGSASVAEAAQAAVQEVKAMGGKGGVIVLGTDGSIAMPFTTKGMFRAAVAPDGTTTVRLFQSP